MRREQQRRKCRTDGKLPGFSFLTGDGQHEQLSRDKEKKRRINRMNNQIREVVPNGVHSPNEIIETQRQPRKGPVVAAVKSGKRPANLLPAEAAIADVLE